MMILYHTSAMCGSSNNEVVELVKQVETILGAQPHWPQAGPCWLKLVLVWPYQVTVDPHVVECLIHLHGQQPQGCTVHTSLSSS